jgi:curved DNA-binding protein CbpA
VATSDGSLRAARVRADGWTDTVTPERFQEIRYCQLLGVEPDASETEIKKAYRHFAMTYHPDHNSGDRAAEEKFKQITETYKALCALRELLSPEDIRRALERSCAKRRAAKSRHRVSRLFAKFSALRWLSG